MFLYYLKNHKKSVHPEELLHICHICGKGYATRSLLQAHIKAHNSVKQLCTICNKMIVGLRNHIKYMHQPKEYVQCEICGTNVQKGKFVNQHYKLHHSGQKFPCTICGKEFKMKHCFRVHMETHLGIKYKCYFCPFQSTSSANRCKHMNQKHPAEFAAHKERTNPGAVKMVTS